MKEVWYVTAIVNEEMGQEFTITVPDFETALKEQERMSKIYEGAVIYHDDDLEEVIL